ncbi:MAG: NADP-dependent oxidoreductase [Chitinophagaceae bacterium]|nr:NADP-dependent oxidoreductase [Chitinophagaceae bacterium]
MKAYQVNRYGKNEKLHLSEVAKPVINDNEVLVEIYAASVNQIDAKIKSGEFRMIMPFKPPFTIGHDVAGVVTQVGAKVSQFKIGDEVFASCKGTFAEFIAIKENELALKPKNISMEEAASIPLVGLTAWQVLVEKGNLKKGQKVFIQAGSGGVGTIAIQLAKHLGAYTATTASAANKDLVKSLGADLIIDYKTQDFETILKDYDLVLNSQDSKTLEKSLKVLKPAGKAISISGPPDVDYADESGLNWLLKNVMRLLSFKIKQSAKKLQVHYSFLFMKPNGKQLGEITALIEAGIIRPVIDKVFPFAETNEAMSYVEAGRAKGKVVVKVK